MECVAARSCPRPRVRVQRAAVGGPSGGTEDAPGGDQVGGRVADAGAAEVDDGAQPASVDEQVGAQQVGVDPDGRAVPGGRRERAGPGGRRGGRVDDAACTLDRGLGRGVERAEGLAVVPRTSRSAAGVMLLIPTFPPTSKIAESATVSVAVAGDAPVARGCGADEGNRAQVLSFFCQLAAGDARKRKSQSQGSGILCEPGHGIKSRWN